MILSKIAKRIMTKHRILEKEILEIYDVIISKDDALESYTDNYNIQKMLEKKIFNGYEILLNELKKTNFTEINICDVKLKNGETFLIFTDKKKEKELGYLYPALRSL